MKTLLIMEDGTIFEGSPIGASNEVIFEVVFNTAMAGYLEIITDPAYASQGVVMTYPMIGNYGINEEDCESQKPWAKALIVREMCKDGSNFRKQDEFENYLKRNNVSGICGIDTRALTRLLRDKGTMKAMLTSRDVDVATAIESIKSYKEENVMRMTSVPEKLEHKVYLPKVAVLDFGAKKSFIKTFLGKGCEVSLFPYDTPASEILATNPTGIILSNGPGDPRECREVLNTIKTLFDSKIPMLAVSLGHQLLALANGVEIEKMQHGHHGVNQPVKYLPANRFFITDQNHCYTVVEGSINKNICEATYINVNDGSVEGLDYKREDVISIQFNPDGYQCASGTAFIFDKFMSMMEVKYNATK